MTSKAEEFGAAFPMMASLFRDVDAEAFARGRAEGEERIKTEIRGAAVVTEFACDKHYETGYFFPASVLAPEVSK